MIKGRIVNKHYFFVRVEPRFYISTFVSFSYLSSSISGYTANLYKHDLHKFKVSFTLMNKLHKDGKIRLTFSGNKINGVEEPMNVELP